MLFLYENEKKVENFSINRTLTVSVTVLLHAPVVDLCHLNLSVKKEQFKMETLQSILPLIRRHDWMTSIDLKDAFFHIPVHARSRTYLQFIWEGKKYQFRVLPFGLTSSPRIFTKVLRPLLAECRKTGIRVTANLDDLLVASPTIEKSREHTQKLINILERHGFLVNWEKSALTPTQEIEHLGFRINTVDMTLRLPRKKVRDISRVAHRLARVGSATPRQMAAFLGAANAACPAIMPGRLFLRSLMMTLTAALKANPDWVSPFTISGQGMKELDWWAQEFKQWNGRSFLPPVPTKYATTDASDNGWGAQFQSTVIGGPWSQEEREFHINWKELKAVELCLEAFPTLKDTTLLIRVDNTTAVAYINNLGGTRSPRLNEIAQKIWKSCLKRRIQLVVEHIPGSLNTKANAASREIRTSQAWYIDKRAFNKIERAWGPHTVDLFADRLTKRVRRFFSWQPEPGAAATEAPVQHWRREKNPYANPPWALIPQILRKVVIEQVDLTLVTLYWPSAPWFPLLQQLKIAGPIKIPRKAIRIATPLTKHPLKNKSWFLTAWRISGRNCVRRAIDRLAPPINLAEDPIDIRPILEHFKNATNEDLTMRDLTYKFAWLLAFVTFSRVSDLHRMDLQSIGIEGDTMKRRIVAPKETRNNRRVIKPFHVHRYPDPRLCPVKCFIEYRNCWQAQGKLLEGPSIFLCPELARPARPTNIPRWIKTIFGLSIPNARAHDARKTGTILALRKLDIDAVVTVGNWSSSSTFDLYYRRDRAFEANISRALLSLARDEAQRGPLYHREAWTVMMLILPS
ncbi:uncharacterized protein VTP21DRAFT_1114 [Calcarisporiella thermophila]|uniref:uncharacterized protein n=1 Tax=Calcarisporiella thermophila TaxID=911321 RepID=UPI003741F923